MATVTRPEIVTEAHLKYLDGLQKSGATNVYGAGSYLQGAFGLSKAESVEVLGYWMDSYDERHGDN